MPAQADKTSSLLARFHQVASTFTGAFAVDDIDVVPLAFDVPLPSPHRHGNGNVGICFQGLTVRRRVVDAPTTASPGLDPAALTVTWRDVELRGRYALKAKCRPRVRLDTGGTMFDLDDEREDIGPAGSASAPAPLDPTVQSAMLDQARAQRTRLMDHPNGQALLSHYDEHNETFNTVFVTSAAARGAWTANGATRDMALDTHAAVGANGTVNDPTKVYGTQGVTYNENAFNQQLQIAVNTIAADPNFNPYDPNAKIDPNSPYTKASLAALTFGNAVGQTNNTKTNANPLSGDEVYTAVKNGTTPQQATVAELQNLVNQGTNAGGAPAAEAAARGWRVLDEDDRARVRRYLRMNMEERAERAATDWQDLWCGDCGAALGEVSADLRYREEPDGAFRLLACEVRLPAFPFEIDDEGWEGEWATVSRQRLAQLQFIRSLLQDRLRASFEQVLRAHFAALPAAQGS